VRIVFDTAQTHDISLKLPPEVLAKLETKLLLAREAQAEAGSRH
jgi:hypothetical protein